MVGRHRDFGLGWVSESLRSGEIDLGYEVSIVLGVAGITGLAFFGIFTFWYGLTLVPGLTSVVISAIGLICWVLAGMIALWVSAWFGAGYGFLAGILHAGFCIICFGEAYRLTDYRVFL